VRGAAVCRLWVFALLLGRTAARSWRMIDIRLRGEQHMCLRSVHSRRVGEGQDRLVVHGCGIKLEAAVGVANQRNDWSRKETV